MKNISIVIFTLLLIAGCDTASDTPLPSDYTEEQSSVLQQSVISKTNTSVTFKVVAGKPSSCGDYSRSEISITDSVVFVKVFHRYPKDVGCLAVLSSYEAEIIVSNLPIRNRYIFKFWDTNTTTKDTVVVF